jgi:hypothetical protein
MPTGPTHRALAATIALAAVLLTAPPASHAEPPATAVAPGPASIDDATEVRPEPAAPQLGQGGARSLPLTRAAERRQVRSIDPGAWLERFGSVRQRRITE